MPPEVSLKQQVAALAGALVALVGLAGVFAPEQYARITMFLPVAADLPRLPWFLLFIGLSTSFGIVLGWILQSRALWKRPP